MADKKFTFSFAAPAAGPTAEKKNTDDGADDGEDDGDDDGQDEAAEIVPFPHVKALTDAQKAVVAELTALDARVVEADKALRAAVEAAEKAHAEAVSAVLKERSAKVSSVPKFWLESIKAQPFLGQTVEEHDEPILALCTDVRCAPVVETDPDDPTQQQTGFEVVFSFPAGNKYFSNTELRKVFFYEPDFPGASFERAVGTEIKWLSPEVNATVELVKTTVGGGGGGRGRRGGRGGRGGAAAKPKTKIEERPRASFFRFFSDAEAEMAADEDADPEQAEQVEEDNFEVACLLRNTLWLHAVQWFTGDAYQTLDPIYKHLIGTYSQLPEGEGKPSLGQFLMMQQGDDDGFDFGDEDDDGDDEDDEEDDEDDAPPARGAGRGGARGAGARGGRGGARGGGRGGAAGGNQQDCQQQQQ